MRRSTGAASGLIILILGVWGALIPFVGPYFNFSYSPDTTWHWTTGRLWLDVIPGVLAAVAGLMLMGAGRRGRAGLAAWLALCAGIWFVCGPMVSELWNHGVAQTGVPLHGKLTRVLEQLAFYQGIGVAITALAGVALGRLVPYRAIPVEPGPATTRTEGEVANERTAVSPERRTTTT